MKYSVVVPARNEEGNIRPLYEAVKKVMDGLEARTPTPAWELIIIDDGSTDKTGEIITELSKQDPRVKMIQFRRSFGQTAGWSAGFDHASGEIVIVLDADLQNDPEDIPKLLKKLDEGYDVVSGWRQKRKDDPVLMLGSKFGNWLHRYITGEKIHDHGCSLKVYRREALKDLELYGEMHRYITALLSWKGFKVGEEKVRHRPRERGNTKYSIRKKMKGFLDLVIVKFWVQYSARPMHFFGMIGATFIATGFLLGGTLGLLWLLRIIALSGRSSPLLAVLLVLLGFQFLLTGVLADVVAHTYYAEKKAYTIKHTRGFDETTAD
jgi:glycosyltransferase involved in cell wall biosynthesis